jgi:feruloyl esterase
MQNLAAEPTPPDLTRPIYPYPFVAKYNGTGNIRDAASFMKGPAHPAPPELFTWLGSSFYALHPLKWCTGGEGTIQCKETR